MKKYILVIISILIFSCNHSEKKDVENKKTIKKELRPFFDSDKIDHYYINYSVANIFKFNNEKLKSKNVKEFSDIFMGYYPDDTIPKKNFEKTLLRHNYKKMILSLKQQKEIESIFSEKDSLQTNGYACVPEYRDIFLFKKKEKTIGLAKICFKCGRFQIIGSQLDTSGFGLWEELDKLKSIVRNTKKS